MVFTISVWVHVIIAANAFSQCLGPCDPLNIAASIFRISCGHGNCELMCGSQIIETNIFSQCFGPCGP